MNCRPRRLFKEIGQRIGMNWFKQPRSLMILVSPSTSPGNRAPNPPVNDLHGERFARESAFAFTRRQ
jgi:hypothetical protein